MQFDADEFLNALFPPSASGPGTNVMPTVAEFWDTGTALALMDAADATVERLGVSGTGHVIQTSALRCVEAHRRHDLAGVRAACQAIEQRARTLAQRADVLEPLEHAVIPAGNRTT